MRRCGTPVARTTTSPTSSTTSGTNPGRGTEPVSEYQTILLERTGRVGVITLNRPKALNALNTEVMREVTDAVAGLDADPGTGAIVLTGPDKAFAADARITRTMRRAAGECARP